MRIGEKIKKFSLRKTQKNEINVKSNQNKF